MVNDCVRSQSRRHAVWRINFQTLRRSPLMQPPQGSLQSVDCMSHQLKLVSQRAASRRPPREHNTPDLPTIIPTTRATKAWPR